MKQDEFVSAVALLAGTTKKDTEAVIKALGVVVQDNLRQGGEDVSLPGLGKFSTVVKAARTGRNPKTGESIEIAARKSPKFTAGKALKDAVNK